MQRVLVFIACVALATGLLLARGAGAAVGNPCSTSSFYNASASDFSVWRMEVLVDEAAYSGPSIHDRLVHNWSQKAKRNYRWTSTTMPIDAGTSTKWMTVSAAVIAESVPVLQQGDIVDVAIVSRIDYRKGRAPVVVRRVCGGRDAGCLNKLPTLIYGPCNAIIKSGGTARE